jgi:hypothetical protein
VRGGLQHPLVAADDRQKRAELFLRLLQAAGLTDFSDLQRKLREIFTVKPSKSGSMNWGVG